MQKKTVQYNSVDSTWLYNVYLIWNIDSWTEKRMETVYFNIFKPLKISKEQFKVKKKNLLITTHLWYKEQLIERKNRKKLKEEAEISSEEPKKWEKKIMYKKGPFFRPQIFPPNIFIFMYSGDILHSRSLGSLLLAINEVV